MKGFVIWRRTTSPRDPPAPEAQGAHRFRGPAGVGGGCRIRVEQQRRTHPITSMHPRTPPMHALTVLLHVKHLARAALAAGRAVQAAAALPGAANELHNVPGRRHIGQQGGGLVPSRETAIAKAPILLPATPWQRQARRGPGCAGWPRTRGAHAAPPGPHLLRSLRSSSTSFTNSSIWPGSASSSARSVLTATCRSPGEPSAGRRSASCTCANAPSPRRLPKTRRPGSMKASVSTRSRCGGAGRAGGEGCLSLSRRVQRPCARSCYAVQGSYSAVPQPFTRRRLTSVRKRPVALTTCSTLRAPAQLLFLASSATSPWASASAAAAGGRPSGELGAASWTAAPFPGAPALRAESSMAGRGAAASLRGGFGGCTLVRRSRGPEAGAGLTATHGQEKRPAAGRARGDREHVHATVGHRIPLTINPFS